MKALLGLVLGGLFMYCAHADMRIPEGFVLQVLEPTGGKIARPREWFYTEQHRPNVYMWTLSKEDPRKGRYDTGVRIQMFSGVEKLTRQTPKDFIFRFVRQKQASVKILDECAPQDQGLFTRMCLETEEPSPGPGGSPSHRILYSLFWGNALDVAVVVISGTTADLWDRYRRMFDVMSSFELIDMKRFEKTGQNAPADAAARRR